MRDFQWTPEPVAPRARVDVITMARIMALQTTLGWVVPMVTRPAITRTLATGETVVLDAKQQKPKKPSKSQRVVKAPAMTAEAFFDARGLACAAVAADVGTHWHLVAGASQWCSIPSKLRSFTTARGTRIKAKPDARLPAAQYWPGGEMPAGVIAAPDMPRDTTPQAVVRAVHARHTADRAHERYRDTLRYMARSRDRVRDGARWRSYAWSTGDGTARDRTAHRENVQAAWTARADWRALRASVDVLAAYVHAPARDLTPWVMSDRGYAVHPMLANLELARSEQREADELRAIHLGYDHAVAVAQSTAAARVIELCRLADVAEQAEG
jgi:hypothetical protein